MAEDEKKEQTSEKRTSASRTSAVKKSATTTDEAPREELKGVIRTSRVGDIQFRDRLEDPEGDRHRTLSESPKPGDENYNPYTDPLIPTSTLQSAVAAELAGSGKSPTWDSLKEAEDRAAKKWQVLKDFEAGELAEAS